MLEYNTRLLHEKLALETDALPDKEFYEFKDMYNAYLKQCNVTDLANVYHRLKNAMEQNEDLKIKLMQMHVLMISRPCGKLEVSNMNLDTQ